MALLPEGLLPAEKAALALWLCAARYLDRDCLSEGDDAGVEMIEAARGSVDGAAVGAGAFVKSGAGIAPYLQKQADELATLSKTGVGHAACGIIGEAEQFLRDTAQRVCVEGTGVGPAFPNETGTPCSCGVLDLAAIVETRVRSLLEAEANLPPGREPMIHYATALDKNGGRDFEPFCIDGHATIRQTPRIVDLVFKKGPFNSRDLWHIAYTLHHELVCHAFQGAAATRPLRDAHPNCAWSEGWMDTLAFDLVLEWKDAPLAWLPLRGEVAKGALREFHDHRYSEEARARARLERDDLIFRIKARDAYRELEKTLFGHGLTLSTDEAREIVRRFSLAANAHPGAESRRLSDLGGKLRILLLSEARPEARVDVACACLAFANNRDLDLFERSINAMFPK